MHEDQHESTDTSLVLLEIPCPKSSSFVSRKFLETLLLFANQLIAADCINYQQAHGWKVNKAFLSLFRSTEIATYQDQPETSEVNQEQCLNDHALP